MNKHKGILVNFIFAVVILFVGFNLGRGNKYLTFELTALADIGSLLGGVSGFVLMLVALFGFNTWKKSLKTNAISERIIKLEDDLDDVAAAWARYLLYEIAFLKLYKKHGGDVSELDTSQKANREEYVNGWENSYHAYKQSLSKYRVTELGLAALTRNNSRHTSSEKLSMSFNAKLDLVTNQFNNDETIADVAQLQNEVLEDFKRRLYSEIPFH